MRRLLFLSRLAFICNIFFLLAVSLQLGNWLTNQDLTATIAIIGYAMVVLFNPLVNLCYLVLFILRKKFWAVVPSWLITANILFLVMQIFYILYLNDTKHT
ncbi:MAG TPA: hypothetical protein VFS22_08735 [Flavisolibacter sp.]|nr:hypothetical protein [Flavisolibacter sp.]